MATMAPAGGVMEAAPAAPEAPVVQEPKQKGSAAPAAAGKSKGLPGLIGRGDGEEPWIRVGDEPLGDDGEPLDDEPREAEPAADGRQRDEHGRFVSSPEDPQGAPKKAPATAPKPGEAPAAEFTFAGKKFKSQAEAEQRHKSLEGMFTPLNRSNQELRTAYEAWKADSTSKAARIAELESQLGSGGAKGQPAQAGAQPSAASTSPAGADALSVDELLKGLDADTFEAIAVQAGLNHGGRNLGEQILRTVVDKIVPALRAEFGQRLQPFESEASSRTQVAQLDDVVEQVRSLQNPSNGQPAFPELNDPVALQRIGATWRESRLPAEHLFTPAGLMQAVAMDRMVRGMYPSTPSAPLTPVTAPASVPAPAAAASVSADGRTAGAPRKGEPMSPAAQRLLRALDDTSGMVNRKLGFVTRRPEVD